MFRWTSTQGKIIRYDRTSSKHQLFERDFELRYLKSRGTAFQDLFSDIMEKAYPQDFQRIRPHGNTGDLKCDGYLFSQRVVFQIYGPEEIRSLSRLLTKIREDLWEQSSTG